MNRVFNDSTGLRLEETYYTWACTKSTFVKPLGVFVFVLTHGACVIPGIPTYDRNGKFCAASNLSFENSARVIADRCLQTLRNVVQAISAARTMETFCQAVTTGLETNPYECPFALIYSCSPTVPEKSSHLAQPSQHHPTTTNTVAASAKKPSRLYCHLEAAIGVPEGHPCAPRVCIVPLDPSSSWPSSAGGLGGAASSLNSFHTVHPAAATDDGLPWPFARAVNSAQPVLVTPLHDRVHGLTPRGWDEPCRGAIVMPIITGEQADAPDAILVLGCECWPFLFRFLLVLLLLIGFDLSNGCWYAVNPRRPWNEVCPIPDETDLDVSALTIPRVGLCHIYPTVGALARQRSSHGAPVCVHANENRGNGHVGSRQDAFLLQRVSRTAHPSHPHSRPTGRRAQRRIVGGVESYDAQHLRTQCPTTVGPRQRVARLLETGRQSVST